MNEEKYKEIKELMRNGYTLADTVQLMTSDNYEERFIAEYMQIKHRYNNLHIMLTKLKAGTLTFTPTCSIDILENQEYYMKEYLNQLDIRAEIEGIDIYRF